MHWTHIDEHIVGDVVVLRLEGHMTLDSEEKRLRDHVADLTLAGHGKIVLDLARVPYVDSLGVGEIVRVYSAVVRAGGLLRLAGATPRVREVLEATQLTRILESFDRLEDAIASCGAPHVD